MARKLKVNPSGTNGECITVVKGSKAKITGLTKNQIEGLKIKQTLERQNPRRQKGKMAKITKDWIMTRINHHQKLIEEKEKKGIDDKEHKKIVDYFKKEIRKVKND